MSTPKTNAEIFVDECAKVITDIQWAIMINHDRYLDEPTNRMEERSPGFARHMAKQIAHATMLGILELQKEKHLRDYELAHCLGKAFNEASKTEVK